MCCLSRKSVVISHQRDIRFEFWYQRWNFSQVYCRTLPSEAINCCVSFFLQSTVNPHQFRTLFPHCLFSEFAVLGYFALTTTFYYFLFRLLSLIFLKIFISKLYPVFSFPFFITGSQISFSISVSRYLVHFRLSCLGSTLQLHILKLVSPLFYVLLFSYSLLRPPEVHINLIFRCFIARSVFLVASSS